MLLLQQKVELLYFTSQGRRASPQIFLNISGRQAALAGLVLGSLTAGIPLTGARYLV